MRKTNFKGKKLPVVVASCTRCYFNIFKKSTSASYFQCRYFLFIIMTNTDIIFGSFFHKKIQASRCVGKNSRVLVCHCRRADDRAPGACHCFQLQLLLSQGDRPGRDAVTKFQPCPELSIHAWSLR